MRILKRTPSRLAPTAVRWPQEPRDGGVKALAACIVLLYCIVPYSTLPPRAAQRPLCSPEEVTRRGGGGSLESISRASLAGPRPDLKARLHSHPADICHKLSIQFCTIFLPVSVMMDSG